MESLKLKKRVLTFAVSLLMISTPAMAQTVRGRIQRFGPYGPFPLAGIVVSLDGSMAYASSGIDGMYYIYNVPPGFHTLTVFGPFGAMSFSILVQTEPTDIAPISL
jgi:hypothetical protein